MSAMSSGPSRSFPSEVPVQGEGNLPAGKVPWLVHLRAWMGYGSRSSQDASTVAQRGGWSWTELCCQFARTLKPDMLWAFGLAHREAVEVRDLEIEGLRKKLASSIALQPDSGGGRVDV